MARLVSSARLRWAMLALTALAFVACQNQPTKVVYIVQPAGAGAAGAGAGAAAPGEGAAASATEAQPLDLSLGGSPSKGPLDAKVTIIESSDFECPFCSRVLPTFKRIQETWPNDVRIVFRHNPLSFHKRAMPAAKAAMAAHMQGKFWEFHDLAFANSKQLTDANLTAWAQQLGLNMADFNAWRGSQEVQDKVLHDQRSVVALGARGTPAFFVNGKYLKGAKPFEAFKTEIEAALAEADAELAKGTPKAQLHRVLAAKHGGQAFVDALIDGKEAPAGAAPPRQAAASKRRQQPPVPTDPVDVPVRDADASWGKKKAKVTIVEFSDFECPYCSRVLPALKQIKEQYSKDVRIVFKHQPLSFHKRARPAAKAAIAATRQGKFWEMHDLMFQNQKRLSDENLREYAKQIGLDIKQFDKDMADPEVEKQIAQDQQDAGKVGARGTPTSFVNGRMIRGAQPFPAWKRLIDEELGKANKK